MATNQILITGRSGFLGSYCYKYLSINAYIESLGRDNGNSLQFNLTNPNIKITKSYDLVIHIAGKAHSIPKTEEERKNFFDVNVVGTQNLIKGLERAPNLPKAFLFISSVAVYGLDKGQNINEDHPLNARDPYGLSKIQAEKIVMDWCTKNKVICTILRLPLLIGENPPGNLGAMIKGIKKGYYMNIAGGLARKSMVMAEDVSRFILPASKVGGIYNLTDGYHPNFSELSKKISSQIGKGNPLNIPTRLAKMFAAIGDFIGEKAPFNTYKLSKITSDLTFDDTRARRAFGWNPKTVLKDFKIK